MDGVTCIKKICNISAGDSKKLKKLFQKVGGSKTLQISMKFSFEEEHQILPKSKRLL